MTREFFPAFVGWTGIVFKIIPLIFITILVSLVFMLNMIPPYDTVDFFMQVGRKLQNKEDYAQPNEADVEGYKEFRFALTNSVMIFAFLLLLLLVIDISLIRGSNTRNHKTLMPGMLLYGFKTCLSIFCLFGSPSDYNHIFILTTLIYGFTFIGIHLAFKQFKREFDSKNTTAAAQPVNSLLPSTQFGQNISYAKFDNEKV
ncbi:hypothetical protein PVAND_005223 [Polypedilum vanderplanki]|uniref:Uncharacterized protein n=1 Tax=Polypedilum vanderplanki TaxID=319348 RepID=A0A9J6C072_POLVA|nr:hypothetical protein PVAND_005223 [Polypedilum vanderplanki]